MAAYPESCAAMITQTLGVDDNLKPWKFRDEPAGIQLPNEVWCMIWDLTIPTIEERYTISMHPKAIGNTVPAVFHVNQASRATALKTYDRIDFIRKTEAVESFALIIRLDSDNILLNLPPGRIAECQRRGNGIFKYTQHGPMFDLAPFLHDPRVRAEIMRASSGTGDASLDKSSHKSRSQKHKKLGRRQLPQSRWEVKSDAIYKISHLTITDSCLNDHLTFVRGYYTKAQVARNISTNLKELRSLTYLQLVKNPGKKALETDTLKKAVVLRHEIWKSYKTKPGELRQDMFTQLNASPTIQGSPCPFLLECSAMMRDYANAPNTTNEQTSENTKTKHRDSKQEFWTLHLACLWPDEEESQKKDSRWTACTEIRTLTWQTQTACSRGYNWFRRARG